MLETSGLAAQVAAAEPRLGQVRLVVVDGPAGSGKSTLAAGLAHAVGNPPVVPMDDLYEGWTGLDDRVLARLHTQVLEPVARGARGRYQRYDWDAGQFADWVDLPPHPVLVVEGVGAAARSVDPLASLRIWVEVPHALRMARGVSRDGEHLRGEWERWADLERAHVAADGTRGRADVVVDGTRPVRL
jgi:uridine kinase